MSKNVFIATSEPYSGKSVIAIGLVNMLLGKTKKVGYFKPIINASPNERKDDHIASVTEYFGLSENYDDTFAFTRDQALQMIQNQSQGEMIDVIISKFKKLEEIYDFTVVEGSDFVGEGIAFEFDANISIAKNLASPAIIVISGEHKTTAQIVTAALTVFQNYQAREVQVLAIVVNRVNPEQAEDVKQLLAIQLHNDVVITVIPFVKSLNSPTLQEIKEHLGGRLLFGEDQLANQADHFITGAMQVDNFLNFLKENVLIVTPGDRADIIICALQANLSTGYPKVSGIVLTGGFEPGAAMMQLIQGSPNIIPIISVKTGTFETSAKIDAILTSRRGA